MILQIIKFYIIPACLEIWTHSCNYINYSLIINKNISFINWADFACMNISYLWKYYHKLQHCVKCWSRCSSLIYDKCIYIYIYIYTLKAVHKNSHFPFPWESKKHTGKWHADRYFMLGKCYKSVVACCTLRFSETGLRFNLCLNSICTSIKLYLHEIPDIDVAVCYQNYRYFEIKIKLWIS
jgi:hypothetical protein